MLRSAFCVRRSAFVAFIPMNFLAHFLLSANEDDLRLGNLLGDIVKGRVERFDHPGVNERMRTGIRLHRTIDSFSDSHAVVRRSKQRIAARYGRLSGVIVDVYYDHVHRPRMGDAR